MNHTTHLGLESAPPLLFWHGVMRSSRCFAPLWTHLVPDWRLHRIDHRGHGLSSRAGSYLVADYTADAVAYLRSLGRPAVLYGHSLGALVAACVAAEVPELTRAAILEDPPSPAFLATPDATPYGPIFRGFQEVARLDGAVSELARSLAALQVPSAVGPVPLGTVRDATSLRLSARMLLELDPEAIAPLVAGRWLEGIEFHAVLRRVRCPVLLLQADEAAGGMLSDAEAVKMTVCLSDCSLARFPGVGHLIHWLAPEALLRHVLAFLESLP